MNAKQTHVTSCPSYTEVPLPVRTQKQGDTRGPVLEFRDVTFYLQQKDHIFNLGGPGYELVRILNRYDAPGDPWDRQPYSISAVYASPTLEDVLCWGQLAEWLIRQGDVIACDCLIAGRLMCDIALRAEYIAVEEAAKQSDIAASLAILSGIYWR